MPYIIDTLTVHMLIHIISLEKCKGAGSGNRGGYGMSLDWSAAAEFIVLHHHLLVLMLACHISETWIVFLLFGEEFKFLSCLSISYGWSKLHDNFIDTLHKRIPLWIPNVLTFFCDTFDHIVCKLITLTFRIIKKNSSQLMGQIASL